MRNDERPNQTGGQWRQDHTSDRSRRKFLKTGVVGTLFALSGCSQNGSNTTEPAGEQDTDTSDSGDSDTESDPSGEPIDPELTGTALRNPAEMQFNMFGQRGPNAHQRWTFHPQGGVYDMEANIRKITHAGYSIPDTIAEGSTISFTIRDDLTWHNGDDVTAQDFADSIYLQKKQLSTLTQIAEARAVDETTVELTASRTINPRIFQTDMLAFNAGHGTPQYKQFVEMFRDATTQSETEDVRTQVSNTTFDEPVGLGPFKFVEQTTNYILYERFDDYPVADFNFPRLKFVHAGDTLQSAFKNDKLDHSMNRKLLAESTWPGDYISTRVRPKARGWSLGFNVTREPYSNRRVRQAIAWAVNRYATNIDTSPSGLSQQAQNDWANQMTPISITELSNAQHEEYLGDVGDSFPAYGYWETGNNSQRQSSQEKAASILEEEGFSRQNGKWMTPNGNRFSFTITSAPAFTGWMKSCQQQLKAFGIDASLEAMEGTNFWSSHRPHDWDLTSLVWGGAAGSHPTPHPYRSLSKNITDSRQGLDDQYGAEKDGWDVTHYVCEVPMPVGDPEGSLQEVDYTALQQELSGATDPQRINELTQKLAWVNNQNVPQIPLNFFPQTQQLTTDHWNWPAADSAFGRNRMLLGPLPLGEVQAKTE
jgi:peptide/nickel transport system substrate-binding protein